MLSIQAQVASRNTQTVLRGAMRGPVLSKLNKTRRVSRHAAAEPASSVAASLQAAFDAPYVEESSDEAFPYPLPKDPQQAFLSSIPYLLFYPAMAGAIAGVGFLGTLVGRTLPVERESKDSTSVIVGVVAAAGAAFAANQAKKKRDSAAVVDLYNTVVALEDPSELSKEAVKKVGDNYGITMRNAELEGCQTIYGQYLEHIIPLGDEQLTGEEMGRLRSFKEALGLSDEDVAPVHLDLAARLQKASQDARNRKQSYDKAKAFSRLIYLSNVMFGEQKSVMLMPWVERFSLRDAQVLVARRDNAKAIFRKYVETQFGGYLPSDRESLRAMREKQAEVKLFEESAQEIVKEYSRKFVEMHLQKAVDIARMPRKARDLNALQQSIDTILTYSSTLASYAGDEELISGLGPVTVMGGAFSGESKARDVKDTYRVYLDALAERDGEFSPAVEEAGKQLAAVLCLNPKDAQALQDEVGGRLYKQLLREEVASKRLDAAPSPAAVLQSLCEKVRFSPQAAFALHATLYKQKLTSLLEKKKLTSEDEAELARIRRILCITPEAVKEATKEVAGKILEDAIGELYKEGSRPITDAELKRIDQAMKDIKMDKEVALDVLNRVTRDKFRQYATEAQKQKQDRKASAGIVKKLIQFNSLVVTPLLERIKTGDKDEMEAAKKELAELMAEAMKKAKEEDDLKKAQEEGKEAPVAITDASKEGEAATADATKEGEQKPVVEAAKEGDKKEGEAAKEGDKKEGEAGKEGDKKEGEKEDPVKLLQKAIQAGRGEYVDQDKQGQKEITLKDDMEAKARGELYKSYLMHTMTGDMTEIPVGGVIRKKGAEQARQVEMARLSQLSDILGMNQMEVMQVHQGLSETAYKAQAEDVMKSGAMTEEKTQYLESIRNQLGLPKESADKVLREVRTQVFGHAAAMPDGGKWTLERILEESEKGTKIDTQVEETTRRNLYRREIERQVSNGAGELDSEYMLKKLPEVLALEEKKVKQVVKEMVGSRKRTLLVQAVSQYRQKRLVDVVVSLNNLVSAARLMPEEHAMPWKEHSEMRDIYQAFCVKEEDVSKQAALQQILGISDEEASELRAISPKELAAKAAGHEDELFF